MCVSLKVLKNGPSVLGTAAVIRLRRVRVAWSELSRRLRRDRLRSLAATRSRFRSAEGRVFVKTIRVTDPALLPGEGYVSSFSLRRHSHVAGRGFPSRRRDRCMVLIASAFSGDESAASAAALTANAHCRNGRRGRRHVCGCADVAAAGRRAGRRVPRGRARVERGGRWFFRQGSARASGWASLRASPCGSAWSLRPEPGRPCGWSASGASRSGDIFIYVVPRGCRP
jgi:hypothetical protein